jgi:hypothetical protein
MKKHIIILPALLLIDFCLKAVPPLSMIPTGTSAGPQQCIYDSSLMDSVELKGGRILLGRIVSCTKDSLIYLQIYNPDKHDFSNYGLRIPFSKIVRINGEPIEDLPGVPEKKFPERFLLYPRIVFEIGVGHVQTPFDKLTDLMEHAAAAEGIEIPPLRHDIQSSFFGIYITLGLRFSDRISLNAGGIVISERDKHEVCTFEAALRYFIISSRINLWISAGYAMQSLESTGSLTGGYEYTWSAASSGYLLGTGLELVMVEYVGFFASIRYLRFPEKQTLYNYEASYNYESVNNNHSGKLQKIDLSSTILFFGINFNM